jgi:hypothetical protein
MSSIRRVLPIPSSRVAIAFCVGLAATLGLMYAVATADPSVSPDVPAESLPPGDASAPRGSTRLSVVSVQSGVTAGRFTLLPSGSAPAPDWMEVPGPADKRDAVTLAKSEDFAAAAAAGLPLRDPPAPEGFDLTWAGAETFDAGTKKVLWNASYRLESRDHYPIDVTVRKLKPNAEVVLVDYAPESGHAFSTLTISGVPALFVHGTGVLEIQPATQVWLIIGEYLVYIDAPAHPMDQLLGFTASWITTHRDLYDAN